MDSAAPSGFYYAFYVADGLVAAQAAPLYVENDGGAEPAGQLAVYRAVLVACAGGGLLATYGNLAPRDVFWSTAGLVGAAALCAVAALYMVALFRAYGAGGPRMPDSESETLLAARGRPEYFASFNCCNYVIIRLSFAN